MERFRMVIGGKEVDALSGRTFESENPYTGPAVGGGAGRRGRRTWTRRSERRGPRSTASGGR